MVGSGVRPASTVGALVGAASVARATVVGNGALGSQGSDVCTGAAGGGTGFMCGSCLHQLHDFVLAENVVRLLRGEHDPVYQPTFGLDVARLEIEQDVAHAAHRPDFNYLFQAEPVGRHAGIDPVGEP